MAGLDAPYVGFNPSSGFITQFALLQKLLHRGPVGFYPSPIMSAVTVRGNADLSKLQLGTVLRLSDVEDRYRIMVGPPSRCPPGLNDFFTRSQDQIESGKVTAPSGECSSNLAADYGPHS